MAQKKRTLYFSYDPNNPMDIHVMFDLGHRNDYPTWGESRQWTKPVTAEVTKMAKNGLFSTLVVHTSGTKDAKRPRLTVTADTDMGQMLDLVRQMGGPWSPPPPKPKLQVPFDTVGNLLHRVPRPRRSYETGPPLPEVVWKDNHEFRATMTFGEVEFGGRAASLFHLTDEQGRRYGMFLDDLQVAIHHVNHGKLAGRFTFRHKGESYGVRFLESERAIRQKLEQRMEEGKGKPKQLGW